MAFDARAVANEVLEAAERQGKRLTHLQLQKLIYFAHGWSLALFDSPLIDEQVEAWKYGPVVSSVYRAFQSCGNSPIQTRSLEHKLTADGGIISRPRAIDPTAPGAAQAKSLIDRVVHQYGKFSGTQLSTMTHEIGTPWHVVSLEHGGAEMIPRGTDIPREKIKAHFIRSRTTQGV